MSVQPAHFIVREMYLLYLTFPPVVSWPLPTLLPTGQINPDLADNTFLLHHLILITHFRSKPDNILGEQLAVQTALTRLAESEVIDEAPIATTGVLEVEVTTRETEECVGLGQHLRISVARREDVLNLNADTLQAKTALVVSGFSSLLDLETGTGSELSNSNLSVNLVELGSRVRTIFAAISAQFYGSLKFYVTLVKFL